MNSNNDYHLVNKKTWNEKVSFHIDSDFYDMSAFLNGKNSLPFTDIEALGDISNKKVIHLQCHFGQDTLSMARMGANVTGVDFSEKAIEKAKEINNALNLSAKFVCCNVYDTLDYVDEKFDIVYTSYGTIGWLPDVNKWANIIAKLLKPNGKLVFFEFHPVVWMYDNFFNNVAYSYFKSDAIVEVDEGTYADKDATIKTTSVTWNHSLSEVFSALLKNNIEIIDFEEYNFSHYNCFNETEEFEPNKYRIKKFKNNIPMMYKIIGRKKN